MNSKTKKTENWDIIVKPKSGFSFDLKEVFAYKDLIILLVKRDITSIYKQTILGPIWMVIQPIFTTAIYTFTFSSTAKMSTDSIPPILFYLMGQVFWTYFADSLNKTSNTFISNASVFGKVYFPRIVVPISIIMSNIIKLSIQLLLFVLVYVYYHQTSNNIHLNAYLLLLPFVVISLGIFGLSLGIIFSSLTTKYRDFTFLLGFAVQLIMFASCVVFPLSIYSHKVQSILIYNPIVCIMEFIRYTFTGQGYLNLGTLIINELIILVFFLTGILFFNKTAKSFMDTV